MAKKRIKKIINIIFLVLTMAISIGLTTEGFSTITSARESVATEQTIVQTTPDVITAVNGTVEQEETVVVRVPEISVDEDYIPEVTESQTSEQTSSSNSGSRMPYVVLIMGAGGICASALGILCVARNK